MTQRITDLTISALATVAAVLLSWPFWRNYEYWPESHLAWLIYFITGFVLAVYVFYIFIGSLRILFMHDTQEQSAAPNDKAKTS
jgi:type VI protein secretion system component VasK